MRVTRFIAVPMMSTMAGGPEEDRTLSCHAPRNTQGRPEGIATLKTTMGKETVISQSDAQHGHRVQPNAKEEVQRGEPPVPENESGTHDGNPGNHNRDDGGGTFGALRRTGGRGTGNWLDVKVGRCRAMIELFRADNRFVRSWSWPQAVVQSIRGWCS